MHIVNKNVTIPPNAVHIGVLSLQVLKLIKGGKIMKELINLIGLIFFEISDLFSSGSLDCMSCK